MFSKTTRRTFMAAVAATGTGLATTGSLVAQKATPAVTPDDHDDHDHDDLGDASRGDLFLLVGDADARLLTVYNPADGSVIETLQDVVLNSHAGTIPLGDGSVLFVDELGQRLVRLEVHGDHVDIHEAPVPGHVAHIAIESDHAHYCAVGTSAEDEHQLLLVDLESWEVTSLQLPDAGEVGLMVSHDNLFHRNSKLNRLEAYELQTLLDGTVEMLGTVEIGTAGHGEALNEETGELFMLTDDGVDIAYWESPELSFGKTLEWPASEPSSRGYFARLIGEGSHLLTYTADRSAPETEWHTWKNRSVIYDIASGEPIVADFPDGYVFRYALAMHSAAFVVIGADDDVLISIDTDPESVTFGTVLSTVTLDPMSDRAAPGDRFYEKAAYRALTVSPDGSQVFVTRGGDGEVQIIEPTVGTIAGSLQHESPLTGGGTLAVFGTAVPVWDTIGR